METKRVLGRILLASSVALSVLFVLAADVVLERDLACDAKQAPCLTRSVAALDPPFLWTLLALAGVSAACGGLLMRSANREPPERAVGFTWDDLHE
jgi:hypothetical protein